MYKFILNTLIEDMEKSEQDVNLVHYSPEQGLKTIEPRYHGVRGIGAEVRHTSPEHKMSFYYIEGTKPEDLVVSNAKSKYTTKLGGKRVYDIATDPEGVIAAAKEKTNEKSINRGVFTHDDMHHAIKSAGYHGFKNSSLGPQMGNVIAMYHPMAIHQEEPIEFGKSENDLEKGFKSAVAGLGLMAGLAGDPSQAMAAKPAPQQLTGPTESSVQQAPKQITQTSVKSPKITQTPKFGSQPEDHFLHNVMQVETSGGKNLKHPEVKFGTQKGTTAVGRFALMPNTIKEIANRYRLQGNNHPEVSAIHKMPAHQVSNYVTKNPHVELELARSLARHVIGRHGNNERAAYAWKYGHNLTPKRIDNQKLANDPYTKNFALLNRGQSIEGLTPASVAFGSRQVAGDIKKSEDLEKGINGDWKSEGYKIKVRESKYGHGVYAYGPDRKRVGHALMSKRPSSSGHLKVDTSEIQEPHRGKGLYQAMLQAAADHAKSLGHKGIMSEGFQRSPDATRAWEKVSHRTIDSGYATAQSHKQPDGSWEDVKVHTPKIDHYLDKSENTNDGDDFDHSPSDPAEFHQALIHHASKNPYIKDSVHIYSPEEYASSKTFLSKDKNSGYALKPDGELMSVFSGEKGRGDHLMNSAIKNGAMHLDAFDGYLPKFYSRHGFKEHKREKNWTEGGPDVVYMKRDPVIMVKSENSLLPKPSAPQQLTGPVESSSVQQPLAASSSVQQAPKHSEKVRSIAESYMKSKGQTLQHPTSKVKVDPAFGAKVATAYDQMPHNPHDPEVKAAYQALNKETLDQFNHIMSNSGLKISKMKSGMPNPYMNSKDMTRDIHENNHLWYYPSDEGFGSSDFIPTEHPSLTPTEHLDSEGKPMLANDLFRIVHDYFGHAKEGNTFNHDGEENAYLAHRAMFSPLAARAMAANTRGQNSWVNFGPHGENNRKNPAKTIYADQKVGLLPEWAEQPNLPMKKSESDLAKGSLQRRNKFNTQSSEVQQIARDQQKWTGSREDATTRGNLPRMEGAARVRALHKLHSKTEVRVSPSGEREFLMHRGVGNEERELKNDDVNGKTNYTKFAVTSWSPHKHIARRFAEYRSPNWVDPKDNVISAWIPESSISHSVRQYNTHDSSTYDEVKNKTFPRVALKVGRDYNQRTEDEYIVNHSSGKHFDNHSSMLNLNKTESSDPVGGNSHREADLAKGSLQRRNKFNPNKDVEYKDASKLSYWQEGGGTREELPKIEGNARVRALHKLHSKTEVRKHPKTGERMFLMHRGAGEFNNRIPHEFNKTSWTPDYSVAQSFSKQDDANDSVKRGKIYSAWIPESAIHAVPAQLGSLDSNDSDSANSYAHEHEVIVNPHKFIYAKKQKLDSSQIVDKNVNTRDRLKQVYGGAVDFRGQNRADQEIKSFNKKLPRPKKLETPESIPAPEKLAASETDKVKSFMRHPREVYNDKKKENKRKLIAEGKRKQTGAKKPLDAAIDQIKLDKTEFIDEEELLEKNRPQREGEFHPSQPWTARQHSLGELMWSANDQQAAKIDSFVGNKASHQSLFSKLPQTHRQAYRDMVSQVSKDPDRHFIPSQHGLGGEQKVRARHLKSLLMGDPSVRIDTSNPDRLTIHRQSHTKGTGAANISIHFPTKAPNETTSGNDRPRTSGSVPYGQRIEKSDSRGSRNVMGEDWLGNKQEATIKLAKGSFQSRNKSKASPQEIENTKKWVNATNTVTEIPSKEAKEARENLKQPPEMLNRLKQKLGKETHLRTHPETGEILALLHRGMSHEEHDAYSDGSNINHDHTTSWTTRKGIAESFGGDYADKRVVSAWVPISKITAAPYLIPAKKSNYSQDDIFQNAPRSEKEIIVGPDHNSLMTHANFEPKKDTIGQKVRDFKGGRWNRNMIVNQINKEKEQGDLAASENTESDLKKMSQPIPSFPKIKSITTRPDSEIKPVERNNLFLPPKNDKISKLDGSYGIPRRFSQGDIAAKKFQAKMGRQDPNVHEIVRESVDQIARPNGGVTGSVISTKDKKVIMGHYNPKANDDAQMHEAFHFSTKQIGQKLGLNESQIGKISSHLLSHIHPDDYKAFRTIVASRGYDPRRSDFDEEVVAHMGNYLNNKGFRDYSHSVHNNAGVANAPESGILKYNLTRNPHETLNPNRFKAGYKKLIRASKDLDEDKIRQITSDTNNET
jgi:predicted GNAT family acetyltransferase